MRHLFSTAVLAVIAVTTWNNAAAQFQPIYTCQVIATSKVNARDAPNTDASITGQFEPDQTLLSIGMDETSRWYEVLLADQSTVWVFGELLQCDLLPTPTAPAQVIATGTPAATATNTPIEPTSVPATSVLPTSVLTAIASSTADDDTETAANWVIPVSVLIAAVIAALAIALGVFVWRKRKRKQSASTPTPQPVVNPLGDYMGATTQLPAMGQPEPDETQA